MNKFLNIIYDNIVSNIVIIKIVVNIINNLESFNKNWSISISSLFDVILKPNKVLNISIKPSIILNIHIIIKTINSWK